MIESIKIISPTEEFAVPSRLFNGEDQTARMLYKSQDVGPVSDVVKFTSLNGSLENTFLHGKIQRDYNFCRVTAFFHSKTSISDMRERLQLMSDSRFGIGDIVGSRIRLLNSRYQFDVVDFNEIRFNSGIHNYSLYPVQSRINLRGKMSPIALTLMDEETFYRTFNEKSIPIEPALNGSS